VPRPTPVQLRQIFVNSMVPFVVFGFVDQTVLIHAGDVIDNTMGVLLGLPTLAAAAMGQVVSDTCGVLAGGTIEAFCFKLGLSLPGLTDAQWRLYITKRVSSLGGICGIILGCCLGMLNLLTIDLHAAERAKKAQELEMIMRIVMTEGGSTMDCERATLWLVDEDKQELWSSVAHGVEGILKIPSDEKTSVAAWVAHHKAVANIPDVSKDSRWNSKISAGVYRVINMLAAPVIDKDGQAVAVIQLLNKADQSGFSKGFNQVDEKIMGVLCRHAAIFLEHLGK